MAARQKTGGRQAGTPNRATADVRAAAQVYTAKAVATLASIMADTEQPGSARIAAVSALLDRAHGKPRQPITGELGQPPAFPTRPDLSGLNVEQLRALAAIPTR